MQSYIIFLLEERSSTDPRGVWTGREAGDTVDALKGAWNRKWFFKDNMWQARKRYVNSENYQSVRIREIKFYSEDFAVLAAQWFKGGLNVPLPQSENR